MRPRALLLSLFLFTIAPNATGAQKMSRAQLLEAVTDGRAIAMMRHALAPGTGDPANFDVDDCSTQRNLSAEGREQAMMIGAEFASAGIANARVFTSAWCRCRETAELMGIGPVEVFGPLNSFFRDRAKSDPQTAALKDWLDGHDSNRPLVLVTHQVNITALTNVVPRSGGTVVISVSDNGDINVLGTF